MHVSKHINIAIITHESGNFVSEVARYSVAQARDANRIAAENAKALKLHNRVLLEVTERLAMIERYVVPVNNQTQAREAEAAGNPEFDPNLAGIPFNGDPAVRAFFRSQPKILALHRFILLRVPWNYNNFASEVVATVCTNQYRREHYFPGRIR